jgi:uncharacterized protein YcbX
MSDPVGIVATLSRFPVKSMQGEQLPAAELTEHGLVGDRAYALVETDTGKVMSGKNPRLGVQLLACRAEYLEAPGSGDERPPVRITFPDGTSVTSDVPDADATLSSFFGRGVTLQRAAPDDFRIDQYHPDVEDLGPEGHRDTITETRLGASFFAQAGIPSPVRAGSFLDLFPVSVLTTSTLIHLQTLRPESRFDARRFRMNVVVDTPEGGPVENGWIGRTLQIGDTARVAIFLADPRCVMTTLQQGDLPRDNEILRTLVRHNRLDVAGGRYPCAGVYAVVESGGIARAGDRVMLV